MDASALQRTLDAIDAVTACGWCTAPLTADAPSPNFCSEPHQDLWYGSTSARAHLLVPASLREVLEELQEYVWTERPRIFDVPPRQPALDILRWRQYVGLGVSHERRPLLIDITSA